MKKILIIILIIVVTLTIIVWAGKDILLGNFLKNAIKTSTSLESTASVHLSILKKSLIIKNLELFNPPDYQDKIMMYIPEFFVKCDIGALLKKTIYLEEVRLNLNELNVIKNADGRLNIKALKPKPKKGEPKQPVTESKVPVIQIARLNLKIGKAIYKDYTKTPPDIKEFDVNLEEEIENITGIEELIRIITQKALLKTAINKLLEIDVEELKKKATDIIMEGSISSKEDVEQTAKELKKLFKKEFEKLKTSD